MPKLKQSILFIIIGILVVNVIGLWTFQVVEKVGSQTTTVDVSRLENIEGRLDKLETEQQAQKTILNSVQDTLNNLKATVATLSGQTVQTVQQVVSPTSTTSQSKVKEYFIYLGTGNTTHRTWQDMTGAVATIDTNSYSKIKAVYFQAALSIIGGEAHARLINKTNGQVYYQTEVFHNTNDSAWKESQSIYLTNGINEYMVQLRSSSGEIAKLNGARIKIVVE